jgi:hypothetical protein
VKFCVLARLQFRRSALAVHFSGSAASTDRSQNASAAIATQLAAIFSFDLLVQGARPA